MKPKIGFGGINQDPATSTKQDSIISALGGSVDYDILIDDTTTANITYIGYAAIGSATSASVWRIKRIDESSNFALGWADGNTNFDKIWNNRVSLTYSK